MAEFAILDIRVTPKSNRDELQLVSGVVKAYVRALPEDGKANEAVIALLSKRLKVPKSSISISRGSTSRQKQFRLIGITSEQILERLASS